MSNDTQDMASRTGSQIGRTPWDAAVSLLGFLGNAVPYFMVLVIGAYSLIEMRKADQTARIDAATEWAARVEQLIALQESGFQSYETLRKGQIETLEKLNALTSGVITSTSDAQGAVDAQRAKVAEAATEVKKAEAELSEARDALNAQESRAQALQTQLIASESQLDLAFRITEYVASGATDRPLPLSRTILSETFEGSAPDAMRTNALGQRRYGSFRITGEEMDKFLRYCAERFPRIAADLVQAGGAEAAQAGTEEFHAQWVRLSGFRDFRSAQVNYVTEEFYRPLVEASRAVVANRAGETTAGAFFDLRTIQAVLWSIAVQHGRREDLVERALLRIDDDTITPKRFVEAIYEERRQAAQYFPKEPPEMHRVLEARYVFEERAALGLLAEEIAELEREENP